MITQVGELAIAASGWAGITVPRIGLFTNDFDPGKDAVYADFTLANYTGYSNVTVTLSASYISQPDDLVSSACSQAVFTGSSAADGQSCFGWFLFDNGTHAVFAAGRFDSPPVFMESTLDRVAVDVELHLSGSTDVLINN